MAEIKEIDIIKVLKKVNEPDLGKDLVTLNMVKDVKVNGNDVSFTVVLKTPSDTVKEQLQKETIEAVKSIPGVNSVKVDMVSEIKAHKDEKKDKLLPGVKNTIAVASGKGGVGKSTVAVNLAVALAKDGAKVGLVDADIYGPSIPLMLGVTEQPEVINENGKQVMKPVENYGVKLMSIGFLVDPNDPVIWRGPMASGAIKQFMSDVDWGELDYLIFDLPPGTGDIQLTLVQTIPLTGAVIVTTPQPVSLIDARKGLRMFHRVNVPVFGIVENMSYFIAPDTGNKYDIFGSGGGQELATELDAKFLGGIPIDPRIREGGDNGKPIVYALPDTEHAKKLAEIGRSLAAEIARRNMEQGSQEVEIDLG